MDHGLGLVELTARVSKDYGQHRPCCPLVDLREINYIDIDEEWQNPDLREKRNPGKRLDNFSEVC